VFGVQVRKVWRGRSVWGLALYVIVEQCKQEDTSEIFCTPQADCQDGLVHYHIIHYLNGAARVGTAEKSGKDLLLIPSKLEKRVTIPGW
jgi:hypothetical protein